MTGSLLQIITSDEEVVILWEIDMEQILMVQVDRDPVQQVFMFLV